MLRKRRRAVEIWDGMAPVVGAPCPTAPGHRGLVVGFVERVAEPASDGGTVADLLVAGDPVIARFPRGLPEPWTWLDLVVECEVAPDRTDVLPARVRVVEVRAACPAEAPEWAVQRSMRRRHRRGLAWGRVRAAPARAGRPVDRPAAAS